MIWNLGLDWLVMAVAAVAFVALMISIVLDAVMGPDGFGPFGNTLVVTAGFFATIGLVNMADIRLTDLRLATAYGMAGAFCLLSALAALKAVAARFRL